eukprot:CAMPEP_0197658012 /NCGR_PEP_ID=MMETSP1338-20131121/44976_1 /TAXON_ID=43686 ORGANISM="Pelagodinium beii, Strain RCC1491" /NCGR_SAMPLE_ID=MMETSP1338 /ASSEMBLY_ACC=CAM_ASM_000754 /LENGTH=550 /DNA_ID=CAMNT_0043234507 /DNA_START=130 /DNA_END=1782 /DNA_ORIENTATION=+
MRFFVFQVWLSFVLASLTAGAHHKRHLRHGGHRDHSGLSRGTQVVLRGLNSAVELNGQLASVEAYDESEDRYLVRLADSGLYKKVTPDHLELEAPEEPEVKEELAPASDWPEVDGRRGHPGDRVLIQGLYSDVALNGQQGSLQGFDNLSGRYIVTVARSLKRIKPNNLRLSASGKRSVCQQLDKDDGPNSYSPGTKVVVHGLSSSAGAPLNEQTATIHCFDAQSGRYVVQVADGTPRKIKPANLRLVQDSEGLADDSAESSGDAAPVSEVSEVAGAEDQPTSQKSISPGLNAKLVGLQAADMNGKVVRISSFDKKTGRYVVKMPNGELRKVDEAHLQATNEAIMPKLSICNAYGPKRSSLKVSAQEDSEEPKVLHVLPFHSCIDFEELPYQRGSISFSASGQEVARFPFDSHELEKKGSEVTVYRTDTASPKASLHQNAIEFAEQDAYFLHLVNAYVGSKPSQLSVQRGGVTKVLALDRSYRMDKEEVITLSIADGQRRLKLAFKPQKSRTYCVVMTGGDATDKDDAHSSGLVLHELGAWTSAEELEAEA